MTANPENEEFSADTLAKQLRIEMEDVKQPMISGLIHALKSFSDPLSSVTLLRWWFEQEIILPILEEKFGLPQSSVLFNQPLPISNILEKNGETTAKKNDSSE